MSKIALSGNASGTGTLTIAAPNTNSDRTIDLPDAAGTVFVSGQAVTATTGNFSGNVTLGSSVLATPSGSAPAYLCRAWVNFNGTGTVAIRASGNVSSITDNGTGDYTVNFTTAFADTNYVPMLQNVGNLADGATYAHLGILTIYGALGTGATLKTTTQLRLASGRSNTTSLIDSAECNVAIFR